MTSHAHNDIDTPTLIQICWMIDRNGTTTELDADTITAWPDQIPHADSERIRHHTWCTERGYPINDDGPGRYWIEIRDSDGTTLTTSDSWTEPATATTEVTSDAA